MEIKKSHGVAAIGWVVNLLYWSLEAREYGLDNLGEDFRRDPTVHIAIITIIPIFMIVGYLFNMVEKYARELEEANRLKDLFIDIMRHDLLNPIGSMKNASELLLESETDQEKREVLMMIKRHTSKLIALIQNASKYSKLKETERVECDIMDLNGILRGVVRELESELAKKKMELVYLSEGEYRACINPMLGDVFSNLISNAIKYAAEGKKIEIGILDKGENWVVCVKDWGGGISDENKEKLFTRFERLGKEGVKGTGLGLAIAKRIVELHGGRIWVEDNPDGGSIFFVSLPKEGP
jgi:hypothetical protein